VQQDPASRVSAPAVALIVTGALNAVTTLVWMGFLAIFGLAAISDPDAREALPGVGVWAVGSVIGLVMSAVMVYGGMQMRKLQSWGVCMAGTICAMLPCTSCCILGLPIGIWVIMVLIDGDVKRAFETGYSPPPGGFEPPPGGDGQPQSGYGPPPGGYSPPSGGYGFPPTGPGGNPPSPPPQS
jgi:hypothetical protein